MASVGLYVQIIVLVYALAMAALFVYDRFLRRHKDENVSSS
jgi:hypothetical protein